MFGSFKNAGVNFATQDLDRCIFFLTSSGEVQDHPRLVGQIANTIRHFMIEIAEERTDLKSVCDHFQRLKNKVVYERNLKNHRDTDFCMFYILMSFFFCLGMSEHENAKVAAVKILDMCEIKCEKSLQATVQQVLAPLRDIFRD